MIMRTLPLFFMLMLCCAFSSTTLVGNTVSNVLTDPPSSTKTYSLLLNGYEDEIYSPKRRVISVGMGFGRLATKNYYRTGLPAIGISIDRQAFEGLFGVDWFRTGGYIGFGTYKYGTNQEYNSAKLSELTIASRWSMSVTRMLRDLEKLQGLPEALDVYATFQMGYSILFGDEFYYGLFGSGTYAGLSVGAR